jgi:hypothetical protein
LTRCLEKFIPVSHPFRQHFTDDETSASGNSMEKHDGASVVDDSENSCLQADEARIEVSKDGNLPHIRGDSSSIDDRTSVAQPSDKYRYYVPWHY